MPSYNEIDGIPSHANRWLLGDILRGEMGFKGAVVSDYWGILDLTRLHHVEPDAMMAGVRALQRGRRRRLPRRRLLRQAAAGARRPDWSRRQQIDTAVRRVLRMKFLAGLFENPYADADVRARRSPTTPRRARWPPRPRARSVVLLKNDGTLPLKSAALEDAGGHRTERRHRADRRLLRRTEARRHDARGHPGQGR